MNCLKIIHFNISRTEETYISRIISKIKILDQLKQFVASNPIIFLILFEIETRPCLFCFVQCSRSWLNHSVASFDPLRQSMEALQIDSATRKVLDFIKRPMKRSTFLHWPLRAFFDCLSTKLKGKKKGEGQGKRPQRL